LQDMDVMGKPVEQCTGEPLGTEHAGPFVERQVRGDDRPLWLATPESASLSLLNHQ
jgi:hypothetical protein